jgi:hypothetical protein
MKATVNSFHRQPPILAEISIAAGGKRNLCFFKTNWFGVNVGY